MTGTAWLRSAHPRIHFDGRWWDAAHRSLQLLAPPARTTGADAIGRYQEVALSWAALRGPTPGAAVWETAIRSYADAQALVFESRFPRALEGTQVQPPGDTGYNPYGSADVGPFAAFPAFDAAAAAVPGLGYVTWQGTFFPDVCGANLTKEAGRCGRRGRGCRWRAEPPPPPIPQGWRAWSLYATPPSPREVFEWP